MPDLLAITYSFVNGTNADGSQVNQNFTDVKNYIDARLGGATSAQLWVANASGVATPRTISGDVAISNTGVVTIANDAITAAKILAGAVGTAELATDSVTSDKLNLTVQHVQASANVDIPTSWTAMVGTSSFPPAGTYLAIGTLVYVQQISGTAVAVKFSTDTNARASQGAVGSSRTDTMTILAPGVVLDGSTHLQLQAKKGIAGAPDDFTSLDDTSLGQTRLILVRYQ